MKNHGYTVALILALILASLIQATAPSAPPSSGRQGISVERRSFHVITPLTELVKNIDLESLTDLVAQQIIYGGERLPYKPLVYDIYRGDLVPYTGSGNDKPVYAGLWLPDDETPLYTTLYVRLRIDDPALAGKQVSLYLVRVYPVEDPASWRVASNTEELFNIEEKQATLGSTVSFTNVPITNFMYMIALSTNVSTQRYFIYFDIDSVTITLNPGERSVHELFTVSSDNFDADSKKGPDISSIIKSYLATLLDDAKNTLYNNYKDAAAEFDDEFAELLDDFLGDLSLSKFGVDFNDIRLESRYVVKDIVLKLTLKVTTENFHYKKTDNGETVEDRDIAVSPSSYSVTKSETIYNTGYGGSPSENLGGWTSDEYWDLHREYALQQLIPLINASRVVEDGETDYSGSIDGGERWSTSYTYSYMPVIETDGYRLVFSTEPLTRIYAINHRWRQSNLHGYLPGIENETLELVPLPPEAARNGPSLLLLANIYPVEDPDASEKNDEAYIDYYHGDLVDDYTSSDDVTIYVDGQAYTGSYSNSYGPVSGEKETSSSYSYTDPDTNTTHNVEEKWTASFKATLDIEIEAYAVHYKSTQYVRNNLWSVEIDATCRGVNIDQYTLSREELSEILSYDRRMIEIVPSIAPLRGTGLYGKPGYIASTYTWEYLLDTYEAIGDAISLQQYSGVYTPSYLPIPLRSPSGPGGLDLTYYYPGEYIGGYIYDTIIIDLDKLDEIKHFNDAPGIGLATLFYEAIGVGHVYLNSLGQIGESSLIDSSRRPIYMGKSHMYLETIGVGLGRPSGIIGARLYVFPNAADNDLSSTGDAYTLLNSLDESRGFTHILYNVDPDIRLGFENAVGNGAYINDYVYVNGSRSRWIFVPFTVKNHYRFISGVNYMYDLLYAFLARLVLYNIRVVKIPIIGKPVLIPLPLINYDPFTGTAYEEYRYPSPTRPPYYAVYESAIQNTYSYTLIPKYKLVAKIIAVKYDEISPGEDRDIREALASNGIHVYAALLFMDPYTGRYLPVLGRGMYAGSPGEEPGGLGVALVGRRSGKVLAQVPVTDFGLATEPLYISYSRLRILYDNGDELSVAPTYYQSGSPLFLEEQALYPIYRPGLHVVYMNETGVLVTSAIPLPSTGFGYTDHSELVRRTAGNLTNISQVMLQVIGESGGTYNDIVRSLYFYHTLEDTLSIVGEARDTAINGLREEFSEPLTRGLRDYSWAYDTAYLTDPYRGRTNNTVSYAVSSINETVNFAYNGSDILSNITGDWYNNITLLITLFAANYVLHNSYEQANMMTKLENLWSDLHGRATSLVEMFQGGAYRNYSLYVDRMVYTTDIMLPYMHRITLYSLETGDKLLDHEYMVLYKYIEYKERSSKGYLLVATMATYSPPAYISLNSLAPGIRGLHGEHGYILVTDGFLAYLSAILYANYLYSGNIDLYYVYGNLTLMIRLNTNAVAACTGNNVLIPGINMIFYVPDIVYLPPTIIK